jgi:hypothetical protein
MIKLNHKLPPERYTLQFVGKHDKQCKGKHGGTKVDRQKKRIRKTAEASRRRNR